MALSLRIFWNFGDAGILHQQFKNEQKAEECDATMLY